MHAPKILAALASLAASVIAQQPVCGVGAYGEVTNAQAESIIDAILAAGPGGSFIFLAGAGCRDFYSNEPQPRAFASLCPPGGGDTIPTSEVANAIYDIRDACVVPQGSGGRITGLVGDGGGQFTITLYQANR